MYQDLKNFESSYEVLTNIDDGINVAYVSGLKTRSSGPSNKGADYGPNQTGKVTALGDHYCLNKLGVADMMEEGYEEAL